MNEAFPLVALTAAIASPDWPLVIVGIITCLVIGWQSWETRRSAEATRKSITLQFRPRLIIRGMVLIPGKYVPVAGADQTGDEWKIEYVVANIGGTAACVSESNLTIVVPEGELPPFPPYSNARDSLGSFTVKPGEHQQRLVRLDDEKDIWRFRMLREYVEGGNPGPGNIYCLGFLQYRDEIGTSRRIAFCRRYDAHTQCFNGVGNPDYEYSD